jgi:hypothetical protein
MFRVLPPPRRSGALARCEGGWEDPGVACSAGNQAQLFERFVESLHGLRSRIEPLTGPDKFVLHVQHKLVRAYGVESWSGRFMESHHGLRSRIWSRTGQDKFVLQMQHEFVLAFRNQGSVGAIHGEPARRLRRSLGP